MDFFVPTPTTLPLILTDGTSTSTIPANDVPFENLHLILAAMAGRTPEANPSDRLWSLEFRHNASRVKAQVGERLAFDPADQGVRFGPTVLAIFRGAPFAVVLDAKPNGEWNLPFLAQLRDGKYRPGTATFGQANSDHG